jgi:E1A/CREB-binding protein
MLTQAKHQKVIHKYTDMQQFVKDNNITRCRDFPYFEGDYWPNVIEDKIKEIKAEEQEAEGGGGKKGAKKGAKKGDTKSSTKSKKGKGSAKKGKVSLAKGEEGLADRCLEVLEKHKDVFFIAYLNDPRTTAANIDRPTSDPDDLMAIEMMDGRDGFLGMCRDEHREFSTLRRARHSSLVLLHSLHNADAQDFSFSCNTCEKPIDAMDYRCVAPTISLCPSWFTLYRHSPRQIWSVLVVPLLPPIHLLSCSFFLPTCGANGALLLDADGTALRANVRISTCARSVTPTVDILTRWRNWDSG